MKHGTRRCSPQGFLSLPPITLARSAGPFTTHLPLGVNDPSQDRPRTTDRYRDRRDRRDSNPCGAVLETARHNQRSIPRADIRMYCGREARVARSLDAGDPSAQPDFSGVRALPAKATGLLDPIGIQKPMHGLRSLGGNLFGLCERGRARRERGALCGGSCPRHDDHSNHAPRPPVNEYLKLPVVRRFRGWQRPLRASSRGGEDMKPGFKTAGQQATTATQPG